MPMVDPFTPDAFTLQSLTAAINNLPYQPGRIGQLGLFNETGVATRNISIESRDGQLLLMPVKPVGADGTPITGNDRKAHPFVIPHIPARATITADEVQGVRVFGSENQAETVQMKVNERLATMRNSLEYTVESHRVSAIKGQAIDANGGTIDLFAEFGVTQQVVTMGLSTTGNSAIRQKMFNVKQAIRGALGGTPFGGIRVFCGDNFWAALLEDKDTKATYLNQAQAAELRGDPSDSFAAFGAIWEHYEGTTDANFGADAYAVPVGVPDLFLTRFAPANYNETVNTIGLPYYAKAEPMKFNKGFELEGQSNPFNICTRPASVIRLVI